MPQYYVVVDVSGQEPFEQSEMLARLRRGGWQLAPTPLTLGPEPKLVLAAAPSSAEEEDAAREALAGAPAVADPDDDSLKAALRELPSGTGTSYIIAPQDVAALITAASAATQPPGGGAGNGGSAPASDKASKPKAKAKPAPEPADTPATDDGSEAAEIFSTGLQALKLQDELWTHVDADDAKSLAQETLQALYEGRSAHAASAAWRAAPELSLLGQVAPDARARLAESMLRNREGIALHQLQIGWADATRAAHEASIVAVRRALLEQDVELAKRRVDLADQAVEITKQVVKDLKRWRALSVWAVIFIVLAFALAGWVVSETIDDVGTANGIDGWQFALMLFGLAVFAASAPTLLLLARPLKGVDEWMPGGKAAPEAAGEEEKSEGEGEKKEKEKKKAAK